MDNLFETAKTKKPVNTVMFEMNDNNLGYEYGKHSGDRYVKHFKGFIESLGYEIEDKYPDSRVENKEIIIKGVQFYINTDNASFMSHGVYTRKVNQRKPENRFVTLKRNNLSNTYTMRVYINKEMDADKLRAKIEQAITDTVESRNKHQQVLAKAKENIYAAGNHFFKHESIKANIKSLYVHQGTITFTFNQIGQFTINADGSFSEASFSPEDMKTIENVAEFVANNAYMVKAFEQTIREIMSLAPLSAELIKWANEEYNQSFYSKTMSTDWREQ